MDILALILQMTDEHPDFEAFAAWYTERQHEEKAQESAKTGKTEKAGSDAKPDKVQVLPIHRSKGAEFKAVVLFHITEGVLPHSYSIKTGFKSAIEEERRVF